MPNVQVLPQDRPFDQSQIREMNQSITNLFQTIENQRIKNEEKNITNIIRSVNPLDITTGQAKSPLQMNQEIQGKIDLDRKQRGKPGLFDIFNTQALPTGVTPTEQALNQSAIANILGAQQSQFAQEDRQRRIEKEELGIEAGQFSLEQGRILGRTAEGVTAERERETRQQEATIKATEALTVQRARGKVTTPAQQKSIRDDLLDVADAILSSLAGKAVSLGDRTQKGTGAVAFDTLSSDPIGIYSSIFDRARSLNIPKEEQDEQLRSIRSTLFKDFPDTEQVHDMLDRGININKLKDNNKDITKKLATNFIELRDKQKGITSKTEFKNFKDKDLDTFKLNVLRKLNISEGDLDDNIVALKDNFFDEDSLDDKDKLFIEDTLSEPFSFVDEKKEETIENKSKDKDKFIDAFSDVNLHLAKTFTLNGYEEEYKRLINLLENSKDVDNTLQNIKNEIQK